MTTEHSQDRKCLIFLPEGGKPDGMENPCGTAENQRTTQLTYGPGRESNRGQLGERLYAQANQHKPTMPPNIGSIRLASLGQPRCVAVFFSRTNVGNYLHTFVLEKNTPHTGVDPGKLNERTHCKETGCLKCRAQSERFSCYIKTSHRKKHGGGVYGSVCLFSVKMVL